MSIKSKTFCCEDFKNLVEKEHAESRGEVNLVFKHYGGGYLLTRILYCPYCGKKF